MPMTSKERLLGAITSKTVDHVPMVIRFWDDPRHARASWQSTPERLAFFAQRGWDTTVDLWCGIPPGPEVQIEVHREQDSIGPILHQIWHTPAGDLSERLRITEDWPLAQTTTTGIGLLHDFRTARYIEVPFKTPADLATLPYLFPTEVTDEQRLVQEIKDARALADEFQVPLFVDVRSGLDWLIWLYPAQEAVLRTLDTPEMMGELLSGIAAAYRRRLEVYLNCGVDVIIRSGWYESADFWNPALYRQFAMPQLQWEINAAKNAGTSVVYLMDSGVDPLLPELHQMQFDCLAGIDPATAGGTELSHIRRRLPGKALWGGISGPLHLGRGTPADVEEAVEQAFTQCGKTGFILGPVVGYRHDWPWENLEACDRAWRRLR